MISTVTSGKFVAGAITALVILYGINYMRGRKAAA